MKKNIVKNEKGAITLFVLLSILFFLIIIFSLFMTSSNNKRSQVAEIDKIKKEYQESVDNIDQIYQNTVDDNASNTIEIGDYVSYTPSGTYLWEAKYYSSTESVEYTNKTLDSSSDEFRIDTWRILDINEETGEVILVPEISTKSSGRTVILEGAQGYNNAVYLLNEACRNLYSNKNSGIIARSINIEDLEKYMTPEALASAHSYNRGNVPYNTQTPNPFRVNKNYPAIYAKENLSVINGIKNTSGLETSEQTTLIEKTENGATDGKITTATTIQPYQTFWYKMNNAFVQTDFKTATNGTKYYDLIIPKSSNTRYWLASRGIDAASDGYCFFCVPALYSNNLMSRCILRRRIP